MTSGSGEDMRWEQLSPVIDEAMRNLSDSGRDVILLRFFQNQRYPVIGRRLGLGESAARMRVERALEKLRTFSAVESLRPRRDLQSRRQVQV